MRKSKCVACLALLIHGLAWADPPAPAKPVSASVQVRRPGNTAETISGTLTQWDDASLVLHVGSLDVPLKWTDLTGASAFTLRVRLIDKKDAQAWMKVGTLAWGLNDTRDGKVALLQAGKLDPSLKPDIEAVQASSAGVLLEPGPELMRDVPPGEAQSASANIDPHAPPPKYRKTTPAQAKAAMASGREDARKVAEQMQLSLREIETDHFLVFTDWPVSSDGFIKENVEAANTCVSKQFEIPPTENIFVGKLPVFMFEKHSDFLKFGETFDHLPTVNAIQGYYAPRGAVAAHMAMSKPDFGKGHEQEIEWAYVLTHEFTHAFVARYRTNRRIPMWINEGLAEVIAAGQFPRNVKPIAAKLAALHKPLAPLFDDRAGNPNAIAYPVMRTLTEVLIQKDRKKFMAMFDELKLGAPGAKALMDNYAMTFDDLEKAWDQYLGVH